jgi:hypothetical protein
MTLELAEKGTIRVDLYQGTACPEVKPKEVYSCRKAFRINRALALEVL